MTVSKILVILLNWNGSQDTIECCKSLAKIEPLASTLVDVLIIDNNSSIEQLEFLESGLSCQFGKPKGLSLESELIDDYNLVSAKSYENFILFISKTNHGFSRGCNLGALYAYMHKYDYVLFLNNDTVVEPNFLEPLIDTIETNDAVIPQIRYYHDKKLMWNCGGSISRFGARKYNYAKERIVNIKFPDTIFPVTFATGCCILFRTKFFNSIGSFSEKFFFGEEDIELALRLMKIRARVACDTRSIIYHKVGASIQGDPERILRKSYIHYLNRFVNMKLQLGVFWYFWIIPSAIKVFLNLLYINKISFGQALFFIKHLLSDSLILLEVNKEKFESVLSRGIK